MNIKSKTMDISNNIDNDYSNIQLDDNNNKGNLYISLNISFFMNLCDAMCKIHVQNVHWCTLKFWFSILKLLDLHDIFPFLYNFAHRFRFRFYTLHVRSQLYINFYNNRGILFID